MKKVIFCRRLLYGVLLLLTAAGLAFLFSCEQTTGPKEGVAVVTKKLLIYSDKATITTNGGKANILVKVYSGDDTTKVVSGVKVTFSTSQSISVQAQNYITDANGYARAIIYGGSRVVTAAITASIENFSNTTSIIVTAGPGLVSSDPSSILANGAAQSTITAAVIDSLGQPLPGTIVNFVTTNGTITSQALTDANGYATAVLRSSPSITDINATVTATSSVGKLALQNPVIEGTGKNARVEGLLGTTTVLFRGITISGLTEKTTVFANNADSTQITIRVKETTAGTAISGAALTYALNVGQLRSESGVTNANGESQVILFGANVAGTAVFSAAYAQGLSYTVQLSLVKQVYMTIESTPSILSANGTDIATIKAYLYDADNNPIAGETVYFSTTLGKILPSAQTNEWGEATISLKSPRYNGIAYVTAKYGSLEKTTPVQFTGAKISVVASPLTLVADGTQKSKITITVNDAANSPIVDDIITLSTTLGTLHTADFALSGSSVVDSTATDGKLNAYISAHDAGDAVVTVNASGISETITIHFTDYTFSLTPGQTEIIAGGQTVEITATLRDKNGTITPLQVSDVDFSPTLGSIISTVAGGDGSVIATLKSGNNAGPAVITAAVRNPAVSASTTVTFAAADVGSVVLESEKNSVRIGNNSITIRAKVFDETGNPKPGETVTFSIVRGPGGGERLDTGTAVTNTVGQAVVSFISGMTGSSQNGVEIQARIGTISATVFLTITGQPETVVVGFSPDSFTQNNDGTFGVLVSAIVSDVNRNKVVDGTLVSFSLIGSVGVIDPEVTTVGGVASTKLIYSPSDAGKTLQVTASSGGKTDTKSFVLPGAEGTVASIKVSPQVREVMADGISVVSISIALTGTAGEPLSNQTVHCFADIGSIEPSAVTGDPSDPNASPGIANVIYTSLASHQDQTTMITVTAGGLTESVTIKLLGITLESTANPEFLPSDGQSKSLISVLIKETTTHIPISSQKVRFGASDGTIGGSSFTDENGIATTTYTTGYNAGTTIITVNYGATLVDTLNIYISEVTARGIELFASPTQIAANGISQSTITALLRDDNFNPIVGEIIRFTTTLGTITATDSTDVNGRAEAILTSERRNGQAIVTATFKEHIATTPVNFTGVRMVVSVSRENLFAGEDEVTTVSAFIKDAADVPIVGESVNFIWYLDSVMKNQATMITDVQGRAYMNITSNEAGHAMIHISAAGTVDSTFVTFTRMQLTVGGDEDFISTGGDSLQVWAQLFDTVTSTYRSGVPINFYTTLGTITQAATTNAEGKAYATLVSGQTAGQLTVSASTDVDGTRVSADKNFTYKNAPPGAISLRVDANIVAIGGASSALIAVVTDAYGNPVSNVLVSFKILAGPAGGEYIHPATVSTGSSGTATTYFFSGQVPSAYEAVLVQAEIGTVISNTTKLTIAGSPETVKPSYQSQWTLQDIDNKDGTFTLPVSATVLDINSNGVVDGTTVYFKIEPPEGAVLSPVKTSKSVAKSALTYPSASAGREVKLTASAGGKEGSITFTLPGFQISYLSISANPATVIADGKSTSQIKATIFDANGSSANVPDGTTVSFTTTGGTIDPIVSKTEHGVAITTLTSDELANRYVTVTAQSGILQSSVFVYFNQKGSTVNEVSDIVITFSDNSIEADGMSSTQVTAQLLDYNEEPITTPTTVTFTSNIGQITNFVRSNENGIAVASFSSGTVGTATITATVGNVEGIGSVVVTPGIPKTVELEFNPNFVNVKGSGKNETLIITALVNDSKNNPVADGNFVLFQLVGAFDTESKLTPHGDSEYISVPMPTLNGSATVSFHSGTHAGVVRIRATIADSIGVAVEPLVSSETTQFLVYSGPPYMDMSNPADPFTESHMTIYTGPVNIYAHHFGDPENKSTITVTLSDKYKNPVPEGTTIWFTTTGGYITTATGVTDANGQAQVTLYGGNPLPTLVNSSLIPNPNASISGPADFPVPRFDFDGDGNDNDGIGVVTAYTQGLDQNGDNVTVWNYAPVIFSGPVAHFTVDTDRTTLNVGEAATLTITIYDFNGNPVVGGSKLTFTASDGLLSNTSTTTTDPGATQYYVSFTNNLNPLTDSAVSVAVTVKLDSPNGNYTTQSLPILLTIASP